MESIDSQNHHVKFETTDYSEREIPLYAEKIAKRIAQAIENEVQITREFIDEIVSPTLDRGDIIRAVANILPSSKTGHNIVMYLCGAQDALTSEENAYSNPKSDMPDESWRINGNQEKRMIEELKMLQ